MSGKVYLVGAGPGDPELLTIKARRVLGETDVVLHDALVSAEILRFAPPAARIENVGKRCGQHHITQEEIHSKMVAYATEGLTVVRLKGGDPLLFGRAGEEMEALRLAGIEFEVIPGVSAAFAAAALARIPLTDRRLAAKLLLLSNHRCVGKDIPLERNLVPEDTTVVVYMPGADYTELSEKLCTGGFDPGTPCLVVSCATREQQQIRVGTLESLANMPGLPAPALLIVGGVAGTCSNEHDRTDDSNVSPLTSTR